MKPFKDPMACAACGQKCKIGTSTSAGTFIYCEACRIRYPFPEAGKTSDAAADAVTAAIEEASEE